MNSTHCSNIDGGGLPIGSGGQGLGIEGDGSDEAGGRGLAFFFRPAEGREFRHGEGRFALGAVDALRRGFGWNSDLGIDEIVRAGCECEGKNRENKNKKSLPLHAFRRKCNEDNIIVKRRREAAR